ncbi:MAG: hypothetical protein P0116_10095 [Candidatus Nitrosocosmicus sp.]|nr:hypothetical protein [Candidatus Nitrosocosmicus sp.]
MNETINLMKIILPEQEFLKVMLGGKELVPIVANNYLVNNNTLKDNT